MDLWRERISARASRYTLLSPRMVPMVVATGYRNLCGPALRSTGLGETVSPQIK
jgi:hypothetical protein